MAATSTDRRAAIPLLVVLLLACATNASLHPPESCALPSVDTTGWVAYSSDDFHFRMRLPASYVEKRWSNRSPGNPMTNDFWKDDHPGSSISILAENHARRIVGLRSTSIVRRCTMLTAFGAAQVASEMYMTSAGGDRWLPDYFVEVHLPAKANAPALMFTGGTRDSTEQFTFLKIVSTLEPLTDKHP